MNRVAASIVHRYPSPWRERYEAEVLSLIEDSPVRFSDLGELVRGLIVERARALIEDADHPKRTATILGLMPTLFALVFIASAWATGAALRTAHALPQLPQDLGPVVWMIWIFAFWPVVLFRYFRQVKGASLHGATFKARTGVALLPVLFVVTVLVEWGFAVSSPSSVFPPTFQYWNNVFRNALYQGWAVGILSAPFWPRRRLLEALVNLTNVDTRITSAQTWVVGCRTMIAQGVQSPLDEAQANVDRLSAERDGVLAKLQGLGYRARFRQ